MKDNSPKFAVGTNSWNNTDKMCMYTSKQNTADKQDKRKIDEEYYFHGWANNDDDSDWI